MSNVIALVRDGWRPRGPKQELLIDGEVRGSVVHADDGWHWEADLGAVALGDRAASRAEAQTAVEQALGVRQPWQIPIV